MRAFLEKLTPANRQFVFRSAFNHAEQALQEGPCELVVRKCTKSRDQEEHYHALIADIADQYTHFGRKWDREDMKRLLVAAFKHDTKDDPEFASAWQQMGNVRIAPGLAGYGDGFVTLGDQTRKFPVKLATAFITWLYAFMFENGVHCTDPKYMQEAA